MTTIILFSSLLILLALSVPIGLAIGVASIITILLSETTSLSLLVQKLYTSLDSFPLMAIPLFMLAGVLMGKGGISERILNLANQLVGWLTGGLAITTVVASTFFSALSGSAMATVGAIGSFMIPSMKEKKYSPGFSSALMAAAGCLGVVIPPSIALILYGVVSNVSIGDLFVAAIVPGLFLSLTLMIYAYFKAKKDKTILNEKVDVSFKSLLKATYDAKWAILAPIIILGGIYGGIFTPTEAAAVAIVYALIVGGFFHKELKWKEIQELLRETISLTGATMFMLGTSVAFSYILSIEQIPKQVAETVVSITSNGIILMLFINIFLLIVGAFIDTIPALIMLTPILLPVAVEAGFDPIHFGVIMVVNLAIGFITPPFGANLFVASIVGKTRIEEIIKAVTPMIFVLVIALFIISYVPGLSLFLIK